MQLEQRFWTPAGWQPCSTPPINGEAHLVLIFGASSAFDQPGLLDELRSRYPHALHAGCTTAGEILGAEVANGSLSATAILFSDTKVQGRTVSLVECGGDSFLAGEKVASLLPLSLDAGDGGRARPLRHVLVLSDGLKVNGSELVRGISGRLPPEVSVTGGLAGDGNRFQETKVLCGATCASGVVAAVGFYGERLCVGYGAQGGWDPFGPERLVTRATANVVYEFDGRSALSLYKKYLGEHAEQLPASGLLFPLSLRSGEGRPPVVRSIVAVDEKNQSITFAGDVPEGSYARLMKANFDRLIDGATEAGRQCRRVMGPNPVELGILISCVGRKDVLRQRIEEEVEGAAETLGSGALLTGFYSYGEIVRSTPGASCELHNEAMTITTLGEA
jgi:hypothetical protein